MKISADFADVQLPRKMDVQCPFCGQMETVYFQSQQRAADTGMVCSPYSPTRWTGDLQATRRCEKRYANPSIEAVLCLPYLQPQFRNRGRRQRGEAWADCAWDSTKILDYE